jgi:replication-associated recombination protein RarA
LFAGAFAIPGVQRKLNLLLYGPPGTGKSKLIRTLAMYLQRTVVSAKLSQFQTHKELTNFMDNLKVIEVVLKCAFPNNCC